MSASFIDPAALAELARMQKRAIEVLGRERWKRFVASGRTMSAVVALADPLWVLTTTHDEWGFEQHEVISGSPQQIQRLIADGVPPNWKLLKGKKAREFLEQTRRVEQRRWKAGGN
jgi:hypothetical protein